MLTYIYIYIYTKNIFRDRWFSRAINSDMKFINKNKQKIYEVTSISLKTILVQAFKNQRGLLTIQYVIAIPLMR